MFIIKIEQSCNNEKTPDKSQTNNSAVAYDDVAAAAAIATPQQQ